MSNWQEKAALLKRLHEQEPQAISVYNDGISLIAYNGNFFRITNNGHVYESFSSAEKKVVDEFVANGYKTWQGSRPVLGTHLFSFSCTADFFQFYLNPDLTELLGELDDETSSIQVNPYVDLLEKVLIGLYKDLYKKMGSHYVMEAELFTYLVDHNYKRIDYTTYIDFSEQFESAIIQAGLPLAVIPKEAVEFKKFFSSLSDKEKNKVLKHLQN